MNLPKPSALDFNDEIGGEDKRAKLKIIKIKKKKNFDEMDLNEIKKKKMDNLKSKKISLKDLMNLDLLMSTNKKKTVYDKNRTVPREIHELNDNTDDELFLKIESGSVTTINSEASNKNKFEKKLKRTKDKYLKYQAKAIDKIKNFMPVTKSNENLKFMTASNISKSNTLVANNQIKMKKPPRPPLPKNYYVVNKNLALKLDAFNMTQVLDKPPIKPARRKSKKSISSLNSLSTTNTAKTSLPASVYYKQLRERWLEKHRSKSNLSSICSTSIPNFSNSLDRKFSFSTNQSLKSDDFKYRYRTDFYTSNQILNSNAAEKQSIKSEPTYVIETTDGLPPKPPLRKRLTVSSYLSGSNFSLHRKLNTDYFDSKTDKCEQAVDPLFWKPFSYKTNRVRSLTALYIKKNNSAINPNSEYSDRKIDELNKIYCMPKRPPLPLRFKKNQTQVHSENQIQFDEQVHRLNKFDNFLRPNQYTNLHEVYTVKDAIVGPNMASYDEKQIQTSLEDFHDIDYDDDYNPSLRFIDSSMNNEFESLSDSRNLSDNYNSNKKIKKELEQKTGNIDVSNESKKEAMVLSKEFNAKIKQESRNELIKEQNAAQKTTVDNLFKVLTDDKSTFKENDHIKDERQIKIETINDKNQLIQEGNQLNANDDEMTLNDLYTYVTVQDRTSSIYSDARNANQNSADVKKESTYVTLDYQSLDTDTLADLDSLAGSLTPTESNIDNNLNIISKNKPKRYKQRNQIRNSGLDTEDEDEITDEIIDIAANLQKELKQIVERKD